MDNLGKVLKVIDEVGYKEVNPATQFRDWWKPMHHSPLGARLESSSRCQANCIHCPRAKMTRPLIEMPKDIFVKCINEFEEAPKHLDYLFLHLNGEPLFLEIDEMCWRIDYAKEKLPDTLITFFTNGQLLTEDKSEKLIKTKLDKLSFSVNGGTKEDYETIMPGLSFDVTINNIKTFARLNFENGEKITTSAILLPQKANENSMEKCFEMMNEIGIDEVGGAGINNIGGAIDAKNMKLEGQYSKGNPHGLCWRTFTEINIMADGRVCACCQDVLGLVVHGDVTKEHLLDIWHGESLTKLRIELLQGKHPNLSPEFEMCNKCDFMESFITNGWGGRK